MKIPLYQVDAFSDRVFGGNPAAVCPLDAWPEDALLQAIAGENNLSETAFVAGGEGRYRLRWFTPVREVDLCGHATLASAFVAMERLEPGLEAVTFDTQSGALEVHREGGRLVMDFPSRPPEPWEPPPELLEGLGIAPRDVLRSRDVVAVYASADDVRRLEPDFRALARVDCLGVIATAEGEDADFVSRFFAPAVGIDEDPVTGSAHATLTPYWSQRLGKADLEARQLSRRGGRLWCGQRGERVSIAGHAVLYLSGEIEVPG